MEIGQATSRPASLARDRLPVKPRSREHYAKQGNAERNQIGFPFRHGRTLPGGSHSTSMSIGMIASVAGRWAAGRIFFYGGFPSHHVGRSMRWPVLDRLGAVNCHDTPGL